MLKSRNTRRREDSGALATDASENEDGRSRASNSTRFPLYVVPSQKRRRPRCLNKSRKARKHQPGNVSSINWPRPKAELPHN